MSQGKLSRGYAPASVEELEAPISETALVLLLRVRRDADQRETDGHITKRHLDALAVAHGMSADAQRAGLAELSKAKLIRKTNDGYLDVNFLEWCRPADKRDERRAQWRAYNKKRPHQPTGADVSSSSTTAVTTVVTTSLEAEAVAEKETRAKKEQQLDKSAVASEDIMPTQADAILLAETWKDVSGKPVGISETSHIGWWLNTYDRLAAPQIADTMRRIATRPGQEPIGRISYFDGILRELNDSSKPNRHVEIVRGEGEPPEDLSLPEWETAAKRATA